MEKVGILGEAFPRTVDLWALASRAARTPSPADLASHIALGRVVVKGAGRPTPAGG